MEARSLRSRFRPGWFLLRAVPGLSPSCCGLLAVLDVPWFVAHPSSFFLHLTWHSFLCSNFSHLDVPWSYWVRGPPCSTVISSELIMSAMRYFQIWVTFGSPGGLGFQQRNWGRHCSPQNFLPVQYDSFLKEFKSPGYNIKWAAPAFR